MPGLEWIPTYLTQAIKVSILTNIQVKEEGITKESPYLSLIRFIEGSL